QPQGLRENVGEDDVVWRAVAQKPVLDAARDDRLAKFADAVQARIGVGDLDRHGIDVAGPDLATQDFRRRDGEDARAAADIEHGAGSKEIAPPLQEPVEMKEAAARRAVVAGAEGEDGLDLDPNVIRPHACAIVRAMHQKSSGAYRLKAGQSIGDP